MIQPGEIVQLGAKVLRQISVPIQQANDDETRRIIAEMKSSLANTQGVGLAAPQIGHSLRIIIVASRPSLRYPKAPSMEPTVMINPSFKALSDDKIKDWEGCLSIPGIRALVPRFKKINVSYTDENGILKQCVFEDFVARIFQHEADHLDGRVYLDNIESTLDIISESEYLKLFNASK